MMRYSLFGSAIGLAFAICSPTAASAAINIGADPLLGSSSSMDKSYVDYGYNIGADSVESDDADVPLDLDPTDSGQ